MDGRVAVDLIHHNFITALAQINNDWHHLLTRVCSDSWRVSTILRLVLLSRIKVIVFRLRKPGTGVKLRAMDRFTSKLIGNESWEWFSLGKVLIYDACRVQSMAVFLALLGLFWLTIGAIGGRIPAEIVLFASWLEMDTCLWVAKHATLRAIQGVFTCLVTVCFELIFQWLIIIIIVSQHVNGLSNAGLVAIR